MVGVNVGIPVPSAYFPFSGNKDSFFGDQHVLGIDGVRFYTRAKTVTKHWYDESSKKRAVSTKTRSGRCNSSKRRIKTIFSVFFGKQVARQYRKGAIVPVDETLAEKIVRYMSEHTQAVTLKDIATRFSYHPNYVSTIIRKEFGKAFSEILLSQRMERAAALLKGTKLPIEEIAVLLGYSNSSNFYKAFREYYHTAPREYIAMTSKMRSV